LFNCKSLRISQRLLKTANEIPHFLLVEAFLGFQGTRWDKASKHLPLHTRVSVKQQWKKIISAKKDTHIFRELLVHSRDFSVQLERAFYFKAIVK
jgi:hypothetical protein